MTFHWLFSDMGEDTTSSSVTWAARRVKLDPLKVLSKYLFIYSFSHLTFVVVDFKHKIYELG